MSRISNQANSHKENMPRALQHRAHADAAAGQSSEKENVQGLCSNCFPVRPALYITSSKAADSMTTADVS
ncbi:hypothetical protein WJX82_000249 [Trebouxia sp. C0006]